jgi:NAD-dependent oxidoreductase involved in siderophore biosynthesis
MAADDHTLRIPAVAPDVPRDPGHGGARLARDLIEAERRGQGVIHHHRGDPQRMGPERDAAEFLGRERAPVTAVNEHEHRGAGRRCGEDVQALLARRTVRNVELATQRLTRAAARVDVMARVDLVVGYGQIDVVLRIDLGSGGEFAV